MTGGRRRDDLLSGFEEPGRRAVELRGFFASTLGASLVAFDLAFDLGAYHTVFYSRLLQPLVVSSVLLLGALALRRQITVRPWLLVGLATPFTWLGFRLLVPVAPDDLWYHIADLVLIGLSLLSLPLTLWVLARILAPEYFALSTRRLRLTAVAIVLIVAVMGYLAGRFNDHILTCQEFVVAGDETPANCRPPPAPPPSP
jgi:hypothetical protein